jgi:hypothetical protein
MVFAKHAVAAKSQTHTTRTDVSRDRTAQPTIVMIHATIVKHAHPEPPITVSPTLVMVK